MDSLRHTRGVLQHDLALERQRGSGNDHPLPRLHRPIHRGHQVPDGFSGSRARLDEQVPVQLKGVENLLHHLALARARDSPEVSDRRLKDRADILIHRVRGY